MGVGGLCGLSITCPPPAKIRGDKRHRKVMTIPSNQTKSVLKVRQFVGWFVELHLLSPLSQWTKRGEILRSYSDCPTSKLQIQIQLYWVASNAVACAVLLRCLRFPTWNCQVGLQQQRQVNASSIVGWRQRYLRRRASSLIMVADVENFAPKNFLVREEKS